MDKSIAFKFLMAIIFSYFSSTLRADDSLRQALQADKAMQYQEAFRLYTDVWMRDTMPGKAWLKDLAAEDIQETTLQQSTDIFKEVTWRLFFLYPDRKIEVSVAFTREQLQLILESLTYRMEEVAALLEGEKAKKTYAWQEQYQWFQHIGLASSLWSDECQLVSEQSETRLVASVMGVEGSFAVGVQNHEWRFGGELALSKGTGTLGGTGTRVSYLNQNTDFIMLKAAPFVEWRVHPYGNIGLGIPLIYRQIDAENPPADSGFRVAETKLLTAGLALRLEWRLYRRFFWRVQMTKNFQMPSLQWNFGLEYYL
jgi:hypothetical protein